MSDRLLMTRARLLGGSNPSASGSGSEAPFTAGRQAASERGLSPPTPARHSSALALELVPDPSNLLLALPLSVGQGAVLIVVLLLLLSGEAALQLSAAGKEAELHPREGRRLLQRAPASPLGPDIRLIPLVGLQLGVKVVIQFVLSIEEKIAWGRGLQPTHGVVKRIR